MAPEGDRSADTLAPVAIVGAGIAGLTTALALARLGRDVVVVERAAVLSEVGAGIQLSPNASRILFELGLGDALKALAVAPAAIDISSARDGGVLSSIDLGGESTRHDGAPFLVVHRGDLQALLLAAAKAHRRITLHTGARLLDSAESTGAIRLDLQLASGRHGFDADALIGADGVRSQVRTGRLGGPDAAYSGRMAWRATIPAETWTDAPRVLRTTGLWLGSRAHMVHYPIRAGREINVIVAIEEPWTDDGWDTPGNGADLIARLAGWPDQPRRLAGLAPAWRRWALCAVDPDGPWSAGRTALVGDAAHAMLPFAAQGGAMAIEDGAVLARLLVSGQGTTAERLATYVRLRRPRVKAVVELARRNGTIYHLSGPMAAARDAAMRLMGARRVRDRMDWIWGWRDRP